MNDTDHICTRCGEQYDWRNIERPENPSIYYVPTCPVCNADMTATTVDETWLNIVGSHLDNDNEHYDRHLEKLHAHSRLYHGRLVGRTVDDLIELAQWFDERVTHGRRLGPEHDRDVAFALRRQAREKINHTKTTV